MKKTFIILIALTLVLAMATMVRGNDLADRKIYVDPGHGGKDSGAVGPTGLQEKDVNLRVATVLKNCLKEYGKASVRMSRTNDSYVSLVDRATDANKWGADRFISIHHNSGTTSVNGTETYSYSNSGNGADLRDKVQSQLIKWGNLTDRGGKTNPDLVVLKKTKMAAILTEASFISNQAEEARLRDNGYTWREGYHIYKGICDHYNTHY
jgi:N-acetylmuramoyl-L-alanine amidase